MNSTNDSGISQENVKQYWAQRSSKQGARTVGFNFSSRGVQDKNYQNRYDFIMPHIDTGLNTIDFGSGTGRYSRFFDPQKYIGLEITDTLFNIAVTENPNHRFLLIPEPNLNGLALHLEDFDIQLFFTATVLQHNNDDGVRMIFRSLQRLKSSGFTMALYENSCHLKSATHVNFRQPQQYRQMVEEVFGSIAGFESFSHEIHGETHSLSIINV